MKILIYQRRIIFLFILRRNKFLTILIMSLSCVRINTDQETFKQLWKLETILLKIRYLSTYHLNFQNWSMINLATTSSRNT